MVKTEKVLDFLNELAPAERKMDFDNVGLLVGDKEKKVTKILVALDITKETVQEAVELGAELIVSHHPVIFHPLKSILVGDAVGDVIISLVKNDVSAICMHTNLDVSKGGVNDALAEKIGIKDTEPLVLDGTEADGTEYGLGRCGWLDSSEELSQFLRKVKVKLNANGLRYVDGGKTVKKVAVCGGAGGDELETAIKKGCDTYLTADIKYNVFLEARTLGVNLIDAGHYPTENVVVEPLAKKLGERFDGVCVSVSRRHEQPEQFI